MALDVLNFGPFRLDLRQRKLFRDGTPVDLKSKAFDILCVLATARGEVVTKDELLVRVWPGLVVEENNIQVHVSALRKAFGESSASAVYLITSPGRGYRLLGIDDAWTSVNESASAPSAPPSSTRPSIAVLPFQNLTCDGEQDYFAEGIVEDIITGLSRVRWMSVIARNSTLAYKDGAVDIRRIGRELGVGYVVQGSVRRSGDRVRISAKLINVDTGTHVWAERYDRVMGDLFQVQDEIAMQVLGAIEPGLRRAEIDRVRRKRPESLDAYDLVLRALPFIYKLMPDASAPAIPLLEKSLEIEPDYAVAHAMLAWCYHIRFSRGGLREEDRNAAVRHAQAAVSGAADDSLALAIAAFVIWFDKHDVAAAFELFDRALSISRSNVVALCTSAVALAWTGRTETAIERAARALELSPFDPLNYLSYLALAGADFQLKRYEAAADWARRAVEANPDFSVAYAYLSAALMRAGKEDEARAAARRLREIDPGFTVGRYEVIVGVNPEVFRQFANAWRETGIGE